MKNMNNMIKILNCNQVAPGLPVYQGTCSKCKGIVTLIETWAAEGLIEEAHRSGFLRGVIIGGIIVGSFAALIALLDDND